MEPDIETLFAVHLMRDCVGWFPALVLIVVGLGPVRGANPGAGFLIAGGGVVLWLSFCCASLPVIWHFGELEGGAGVPVALFAIGRLGLWVVSMALIVAGIVILSHEVSRPRTDAGSP